MARRRLLSSPLPDFGLCEIVSIGGDIELVQKSGDLDVPDDVGVGDVYPQWVNISFACAQ